MAKKYTISMDPREASKLVKQYQNLVIEQQRPVDSLTPYEKELFSRFSCVIDSTLAHVKKNPVFGFLEALDQNCDNFEQYQASLFDTLDNIEEDPKKHKTLKLLLECRSAIVALEAMKFEDKSAYHEAVNRVVGQHIHQANLVKTWQEHSQRLGHFMGKRIPFFEKENFEEEARNYFVDLIQRTYLKSQIDDDLINFILLYYNIDNLLSVTAFLQDFYVQLDVKDFWFVQHYEIKRSSDCSVNEDGSLRFEFVAHYFPRLENKGLLMTERYVLSVTKKEAKIGSSKESVGNNLDFDRGCAPNTLIKDGEYIRHPVNPNGDCGYTAFGIDRDQAYEFLIKNIDTIRDIVKPIIMETLSTDANFVKSLPEGYEGLKHDSEFYFSALLQKDPELNKFKNNLKRHAENLNLIDEYITYDVRNKKIDHGWCHPLILHALAHIRGVHLHLYQIGVNKELVPHGFYPEYHPEGANDSTRLLFINRNHFERVELRNELASKLSSSSPSEESDSLIFKRSQNDNEIEVSIEDMSVSFYDEKVFKEFLIPVLSSTLKRISREGYDISGVDKSIMRACAQYYWECNNAKSLREKLESDDLDGERLFALAWDSDKYLSIILSDPLLLGKICGLTEHLALLQILKDHSYNKSMKGKIEILQKVLTKLKPKLDYELDTSDKQIRIFMLAGLFGLHYFDKEKTPNREMINFAQSLISTKLRSHVDFDLVKYLGDEFRDVVEVAVAVQEEEPQQNKKARDLLTKYTEELAACNNSAVLVAKCQSAWAKDPDDPERVLLHAYVKLLKSKPEHYIDSFLMLSSQVQAEIVKDTDTLVTLLKRPSTVEKLVKDEDLLKVMLITVQKEFNVNVNLGVWCLKILVNDMKKPMRGALLRDKKWQGILFTLLLNDLSALPLIIKITDKIEKGLWLLTLNATPRQLVFLLLSLKVLDSKLRLSLKDIREQIGQLTQDAKEYLSDFNVENNAAKLIAQSAKLNDKVDIDEAEVETKAHLENAKRLQSQHKEALKKLAELKSQEESINQQIQAVDEFKKIIIENLKLSDVGSDLNPLDLLILLYDYQDLESSSTADEFILKFFSDFGMMKQVLITGDIWEIAPAIVENASLEILTVLVLVASALNKKTYLPASFVKRIQNTEENINSVLDLLDACLVNPTWIFNLFNAWNNPPKKALDLFQKANEYLAEDFHANRDFLNYLCKINPLHLSSYLSHFQKTELKDWVPLLNEYELVDELADLYVNLSRHPSAENFCLAFMTQPFLDKVLLFASAEKINDLVNAKLDCLARARELVVNDPVFRHKISKHPELKEKIIDAPDRDQFLALATQDLERLSPEFIGGWFLRTFAEATHVFHMPFLRPEIVMRMLQPSYNHTEIRVLPVLIRALQTSTELTEGQGVTRLLEDHVKSVATAVALQEAEADVLLDIFQLNVKSQLARSLRSTLLQSDELLLKLFVELDEHSLIRLVRCDTDHFFVNWLVSRNHLQLLSRRLYACERGSVETNGSLIGTVLANINLRQLLLLTSDPNVCESLALQFSHTLGRPGTDPLLLGVLKAKVDKKKSSIIEFLKLVSPLNGGFATVVSKQNNDLTNFAWHDFLKSTLVFILQAKLSYKEVDELARELSSTFHWRAAGKRVGLVSVNDIYLPCPQLYFLLMILCKPNELLKQFMDPHLGVKICAEFMRFSPKEGEIILLSPNKFVMALRCYQQFYEAAQVISSATPLQRKSAHWYEAAVKSIFDGEELTRENVNPVVRKKPVIARDSDEETQDSSAGGVLFV